MSHEASDLETLLRQQPVEVPASTPTSPASAFKNPLSLIKPYPTHNACGGMVLPVLANHDDDGDDSSGDPVPAFTCLRCGLTEPAAFVGGELVAPGWVKAPYAA